MNSKLKTAGIIVLCALLITIPLLVTLGKKKKNFFDSYRVLLSAAFYFLLLWEKLRFCGHKSIWNSGALLKYFHDPLSIATCFSGCYSDTT